MASLTQQTWVWVSSRSWWWTGKPGVLQFMGSQRVRYDWVTELNWKRYEIKPPQESAAASWILPASDAAFCSTCWESLGTELRMTAKVQHLKTWPLSVHTTLTTIYFWLGKSFLCPDPCVSSLEPVWGLASSSSGLGRKNQAFALLETAISTLDTYHPHKHCFVRLFICTKPKRKAFFFCTKSLWC